MREVTIQLGGQELRLVATFAASVKLAEKVGDPLTIMREASLEAMFINMGIPYEPKWRFTVENVPMILFIGLEAANNRMKLAEVQELVFAAGFGAGKEAAVEYLGLIAGPRPEETVESEGGTPGE
jgi:hypothetical protein